MGGLKIEVPLYYEFHYHYQVPIIYNIPIGGLTSEVPLYCFLFYLFSLPCAAPAGGPSSNQPCGGCQIVPQHAAIQRTGSGHAGGADRHSAGPGVSQRRERTRGATASFPTLQRLPVSEESQVLGCSGSSTF